LGKERKGKERRGNFPEVGGKNFEDPFHKGKKSLNPESTGKGKVGVMQKGTKK